MDQRTKVPELAPPILKTPLSHHHHSTTKSSEPVVFTLDEQSPVLSSSYRSSFRENDTDTKWYLLISKV